MKRLAIGIGLAFVCLAAPARAQGPRIVTFQRARTPTLFSQAATRPPTIAWPRLGAGADSAKVRRTHWLEGGLIGGVVMGVVGAGFCGYTSLPCIAVGFAILGGGIGFPVGALIGGQFPKEP